MAGHEEVARAIAYDPTEPPLELVEMRMTLEGSPPATEAGRWYAQWKASKPAEFMAAYQRAQKDYRAEQVMRAKRDPERPGKEEADEGEARAQALYREWVEMREAGTSS